MKTNPSVLAKLMIFLPIVMILYCNCEKEYGEKWPVNPPENTEDGLDVGLLKKVDITYWDCY